MAESDSIVTEWKYPVKARQSSNHNVVGSTEYKHGKHAFVMIHSTRNYFLQIRTLTVQQSIRRVVAYTEPQQRTFINSYNPRGELRILT